MHCTLSTPHNIPGNVKFREHIQQITGVDMHGRTNSFVYWKHVHLVHGLGTYIGVRMLISNNYFGLL